MSSAMFDLAGRRALVTGGAQGMGRMIAEGLLRAGAEVILTSRDPDTAAAAAAEMAALGPTRGIAADLSSPEAASALAAQVIAASSSLDILINNAGKTWGAPIERFPDKAWPGVMAVNVQAPFILTRELLPALSEAATSEYPARIVNIGSVAGMRTERLQAYSYAASKAAIHMLTRDLAGDLASRHITVNAIIPGFFPTKMTAHLRSEEEVDPATLAKIPLARLGAAEDVAGATVFLCSRAASYVTGVLLPVDGGLVGCG